MLFAGILSNWMIILYASLGILGSGIFILVDLVVVMKEGVIDTDDYILGALNLYLDIVRMFLYFLLICGREK